MIHEANQRHCMNNDIPEKDLGETLMAHNWQKWKRVFLICPRHEIYREKAVSLKRIYLKNYDLCDYVEFGAISWKCDILPITD